jgi:hypothetical protein
MMKADKLERDCHCKTTKLNAVFSGYFYSHEDKCEFLGRSKKTGEVNGDSIFGVDTHQ